MSIEQARSLLQGWIDVVAFWATECTPYLCRGCMSLELRTEAASLALDLTVALSVAGRRLTFVPPTWMVLPSDVAYA